MLLIDYHGVKLSASDFPPDLRGYIAFSIAFVLNTHCRDKEAALELLLSEADNLIRTIREGKV